MVGSYSPEKLVTSFMDNTNGNQKVMGMSVDWRKCFQENMAIRSDPQGPTFVICSKFHLVSKIFGTKLIFNCGLFSYISM